MDYVKDGTLTIQARTIKEVNSIDRVIVYADGCQREYLMPLPTVEERKEGEWNFIGWNQFECTCCGYPYTQEQLRAVTTRNDQIFPHFCPNCGAKMKGE